MRPGNAVTELPAYAYTVLRPDGHGGRKLHDKSWDMFQRNSCMSARMSAKMLSGEVWIITPCVCVQLPS